MKKSIFCLSLLAFLFSGCNKNDDANLFGKDTPRYDIPLSTKSEEINSQIKQFSFDLYREIARTDPQKNFCISPLSAGLCLGMVLNGANNNTYAEMQQTLGYQGFTNEQINAYVQHMQTELPKLDGRVLFTNANSLWVKDGFPLLPDFIQLNQTYYDAEVRSEPFDQSTVGLINNWCREKTKGLIPTIIDRITPEARVFLLNAIYFKGVWTSEFKQSDTQQAPFYLADGNTQDVPMMKQSTTLAMYRDEAVTVVELPYGNKAFSMVVFMPEEGNKMNDLLAELDDQTWESWMKRLNDSNFELYLPRFKMEFEKDLIETMKALGMKDAFNKEAADFSKMSADKLFVGLLKQKTAIEVNEQGTEAAAVTIAGMEITSLDGHLKVRFDRPFGFVIKEKSTGAILFAGKIANPEE